MSINPNYSEPQLLGPVPTAEPLDTSQALCLVTSGVFYESFRLKRVREIQALACVNHASYDKIRLIIKKDTRKISESLKRFGVGLLRAKPYTRDERGDQIFNAYKISDDVGIYTLDRLGGCSIINPKFELEYEDRKTKKKHIANIPNDCVNYAFYQLHEVAATQIVFQNYKFEKQSDIFLFLNLCGYTQAYEAQEGDLICYLEKNEFRHFGIMANSSTVHSKWSELKPIFSHTIKFGPYYGDQYILLRKRNTIKIEGPWVLDSKKVHAVKEKDAKVRFNIPSSETTFSTQITLCGQNLIFWGIGKKAQSS